MKLKIREWGVGTHYHYVNYTKEAITSQRDTVMSFIVTQELCDHFHYTSMVVSRERDPDRQVSSRQSRYARLHLKVIAQSAHWPQAYRVYFLQFAICSTEHLPCTGIWQSSLSCYRLSPPDLLLS